MNHPSFGGKPQGAFQRLDSNGQSALSFRIRHGGTFPKDFFNILFDFGARRHNLTPALCATDAKIHPRAEHEEFFIFAGVFFFHH
jgi:hypothetical protein